MNHPFCRRATVFSSGAKTAAQPGGHICKEGSAYAARLPDIADAPAKQTYGKIKQAYRQNKEHGIEDRPGHRKAEKNRGKITDGAL